MKKDVWKWISAGAKKTSSAVAKVAHMTTPPPPGKEDYETLLRTGSSESAASEMAGYGQVRVQRDATKRSPLHQLFREAGVRTSCSCLVGPSLILFHVEY